MIECPLCIVHGSAHTNALMVARPTAIVVGAVVDMTGPHELSRRNVSVRQSDFYGGCLSVHAKTKAAHWFPKPKLPLNSKRVHAGT